MERTDPQAALESDVVVVGGGAAGLSAALVLSRARRSVVVVDSGAPRNAPASHMQGFLSRDGMPPTELLAAGRDEVRGYGARLLTGSADSVTRRGPGFAVVMGDGQEIHTRRVLVATGLRDDLPDVPGVRDRFGTDVLHCPYCHGYEVRDQRLGVLGGTPGAAEHAILLRQWSHDVVYFPHVDELTDGDRERLVARAVGVVEGQVARLSVAEDRLHGVELVDGRTVLRDAVFVRPLFRAHDGLLRSLGCRLDDQGAVIVDPTGRTTVPGVWAAGNVVDPRAQVITAAGQGSAAAIALNADLVAEDLERDLAEYRGHAT